MKRVCQTVDVITYELSPSEVRLALRRFVEDTPYEGRKCGCPSHDAEFVVRLDGSASVTSRFTKDAAVPEEAREGRNSVRQEQG